MSENIQNNQPTNQTTVETKKCKHCQSDIPKKAKVCPVCKKKQGGALKWIIAIVVIIAIIGACSSGNDDDSTADNVASSTGQQESGETTSSEHNSEASVDDQNVFNIGEIAEQNGVQISVLEYTESTGNDWGAPAEGNVFIFPEIEIVNNSDEEISISSMLSFEYYCDDYKVDYSSSALMALATEDNINQLDGSVAPGKRMKGVLGIEVPADWNVIEIYYSDNVWFGSDFSFVISK